MRVRRRGLVAGGFEAFELPPQRGTPPVDPFEDFRLNQTGRQPRRVILESVPRRQDGPIVTEAGFDRNRLTGMMEQPTSQIGRSIAFGSGGIISVGRSAPLIMARCSDERARQLTVFLTVDVRGTSTVDRDLVALVSWGVGGMLVSDVEVDFVNGAQLSLVASYVQVLVRSDATSAQTQFNVGAFLGYEAVSFGSAVRGPQRTLKTGASAAATPVVLTIPRYASSFSLVRNPLTTALTIEYLDGPGNVMGIVPIAAGADVSERVFPIPGDAMTLQITPAAVDLIDARLIFGLSL